VTRPILLRLLVVAAALASGINDTRAQFRSQCGDAECPQPVSPHSGPDEAPIRFLTGILGAIAGSAVVHKFFSDPPAAASTPSPTPGGGGGGTWPSTCNLPPAGETRYDQAHLILDIPLTVSPRAIDQFAARHAMTRVESTNLRLTGRTLHVWRIDNGTSVPDMIRNVCGPDRLVAGAQPNYLYGLTQAQQQEPINPEQYAPQKLNLPEAHRLATGNRVRVAVIDSGVDASHPDLAGAIVANFDATAGGTAAHGHGTGMAGAIAARRTVVSSAPRVELLTVQAFSIGSQSPEGTTFSILKGLDWAVEQGARIINMSFAGPSDPRLRDALAKAAKKNIVLVAAAGNAGPRSPPLYPGADPNVIAVTATDMGDALFEGANRGSYITLAAPGVDILLPGTNGTYQLSTGTSVAAAQVSGVIALLIERNPSLTAAQVRRILMRTARALGPKGHGYGLVNALDAVTATKPR